MLKLLTRRAGPIRLMAALSLLMCAVAGDAQRGMGDLTAPRAAPKTPETKVEPASIASDVPVASLLTPAHSTGVLGAVPPSGRPDNVGAFRFLCMPGQISFDDPIVFPGRPGQSHLHQWFGNTAANAHSTYESLRTSGDSTCMNKLNRSAYWMPAMLNGKGGVVRPDYVSIYYKRRPDTDKFCQVQGKACVPIPRGLRFVFGYDMIHGAPKTGSGYFDCAGATAKPGHYPDIVTAAKNCPPGNQLGAVISAPTCWDGKNLDSPDHRSHVAYISYGNWGYERCPSSHPYVIPTFTLGAWYSVDSDLDTSGEWDGSRPTWHLSSDEMPGKPMMRPGSTFHTDWFGAWDDETMAMWTAHCINKLLNCSGGDLGNGQQMKQIAPFSWSAKPHIAAIPARGSETAAVHH